jgi:hypothetical protein
MVSVPLDNSSPETDIIGSEESIGGFCIYGSQLVKRLFQVLT